MNCAEARRNWMLYLDSEGDARLHMEVADHLGRCPDCAGWFAREQQLEDAVRDRLAAGDGTPVLWGRVLHRAGLAPRRPFPRRLLLVAGCLAAVALLSLAIVGSHRTRQTPELHRDAAELHRRWLAGDVSPDFASTKELEVDRYFKASAPFPVHCPPRSDVAFAVEGAGVRPLREGLLAGLIVGRVGGVPVSILVLDRRGLTDVPGGRLRRREGGYLTVSAVVADNVVVVTGDARPETLDRLLDAYGSYH